MEYRKICNVCGHIYCFNDNDVKSNDTNATIGALSAIASFANAIGGNQYDMYEQGKLADRASNRIVDLNRCPRCGSRDIRDLTDKEYRDYQDGLLSTDNKSSISINANASVPALIQRGMLYLEEGDWKTGKAYFDNALDIEPTNPDAYIGKMMVDLRVKTVEDLTHYDQPVFDNENYIKALRFANEGKADNIRTISENIEKNIKESKYIKALNEYRNGLQTKNEVDLYNAYEEFITLGTYRDSSDQATLCQEDLQIIREENTQREEIERKRNKILAIFVAFVFTVFWILDYIMMLPKRIAVIGFILMVVAGTVKIVLDMARNKR